jgi:hypothetical protein
MTLSLRLNRRICIAVLALAALLASLLTVGSSAHADTSIGEPYIGNANKYDYSPTMIQSGGNQDWWWCGQTDTDTILQKSYRPATGMSATTTAFSRGSAGQWDSAFVCNPVAVKGTFTNPFGDGLSYTHVIYYVATSRGDGTQNSIGAAFSQNGTTWRKYPTPVIVPANIAQGSYGVSEPSAVNLDGGQNIRVFYGDSTRPGGFAQVAAETTNGVTFTQVGVVNINGLYAQSAIGNSDFALDAATNTWYMTVPSLPLRPRAPGSVAGDYEEREYGQFTLYKMPASTLFASTGSWENLTTIGTAQTGFVVNAIPGFARDQHGKLNTISQWPSIQMFFNVSNPRPSATATALDAQRSAATNTWDISWAAWNGTNRFRPLTRYWSTTIGTHQVTTGYIQAAYNVNEMTLGKLREAPSATASVPLYSCKASGTDYFLSTDILCEGQYYVGLIGYAASSSSGVSGAVPLYRCYRTASGSHFVSSLANCEGQITESLLGYAFP